MDEHSAIERTGRMNDARHGSKNVKKVLLLLIACRKRSKNKNKRLLASTLGEIEVSLFRSPSCLNYWVAPYLDGKLAWGPIMIDRQPHASKIRPGFSAIVQLDGYMYV
jgi:hypothetical protein